MEINEPIAYPKRVALVPLCKGLDHSWRLYNSFSTEPSLHMIKVASARSVYHSELGWSGSNRLWRRAIKKRQSFGMVAQEAHKMLPRLWALFMQWNSNIYCTVRSEEPMPLMNLWFMSRYHKFILNCRRGGSIRVPPLRRSASGRLLRHSKLGLKQL